MVRKAMYVSIRILTAFNGTSVSTILSFPVADPDLELRGGPGSVLLALYVVPPSVIFSFFTQKKGGRHSILHVFGFGDMNNHHFI